MLKIVSPNLTTLLPQYKIHDSCRQVFSPYKYRPRRTSFTGTGVLNPKADWIHQSSQ